MNTTPAPLTLTDAEFKTFVQVLCVQHVHGHATDSFFEIKTRRRDGLLNVKRASTRELLSWALQRIEADAEKVRRFDMICRDFHTDNSAAYPILQRFCSDQLAYTAALSFK